MAKNDTDAGKEGESEVWSAIAAFEQILEAMPKDRTSLETLAHAYEQIGDLVRAKEKWITLAEIVVADSDREAAEEALGKLGPHIDDDAAAKQAVDQLQQFLATAAPAETGPEDTELPSEPGATEPGMPTADAAGTKFNIANEMSFAWNLLQSNYLNQEEYSSVVQDLTEMSGTDAAVTISVLHVLHDRGFKNIERIMANVAKDCGTPVVSLAAFELQPEVSALLPLEFMLTRGVIPFDTLGKDLLVVLLNPYDRQLMKEAQSMTGKNCHFFLTAPLEFDAALNRIRNATDEAGEE